MPGPCIPPALSQPTGGVNNKEPRGLLMARVGESEAGKGEIPNSPQSMRTSLQNPVCLAWGSQRPMGVSHLLCFMTWSHPPGYVHSHSCWGPPGRMLRTVLTACFFQHIVTFCWLDALSLAWWTCCALGVLWLSHCHP